MESCPSRSPYYLQCRHESICGRGWDSFCEGAQTALVTEGSHVLPFYKLFTEGRDSRGQISACSHTLLHCLHGSSATTPFRKQISYQWQLPEKPLIRTQCFPTHRTQTLKPQPWALIPQHPCTLNPKTRNISKP